MAISTFMSPIARRGAASLAAALFLSGCGGSSGSGSPQWDGSTAPPTLPVGSTERLSSEEAGRFLVQASFGPSMEDIESISATGAGPWIEYQLNMPATTYLPRLVQRDLVGADIPNTAPSDLLWEAGVMAPDQLRQRMVYALSQIVVVSTNDPALRNKPMMVAHYMDALSNNAFGNYRDLLEDVTYTPAMAEFLTYMRNTKADMKSGRVPDENYARELMQLFTIGLIELNMDGTPKDGAQETYDNEDVKGLAKVFTGLALEGGNFWAVLDERYRYSPLVAYPQFHSEDEKTFLGLTIPAGTDAETSIDMALDHLFEHPNVAPFVSRQLIQRFVTSDPAPAYVERVARAFEAGTYQMPSGRSVGDGRRGDLAATIAAILLDNEARGDVSLADADFGKVREPTLRFWHWARAFDVVTAEARDVKWLSDTGRQDRLTQHPLKAPSVFNFFRPQYISPGTETGAQGVTAPELQLVSEVSHVGYVNMMTQFIRERIARRGETNDTSFAPQYDTEMSLANDPRSLIDHLDLLLTYGTMEEETKIRIEAVLAEIPIDDNNPESDRRARVHTAILMAATAPEFMVQR